MTNYRQEGEVLQYIPQTGDNIKSGDLVAVENVVGVAVTDGTVGSPLALSVKGVYEVPVPAAVAAIPQGKPVYYNKTNKQITLTATNNILAGYAWEDSADGIVPLKLIF